MSFLTRLCRLLAALAFAVPVLASAQSADKPFNNEQLEQMTAQVALYPDSLLAQLFMATTYPDDFAAAMAWSKAHPDAKGDDAVKMVESEPWDPSVASLVAFPEVLITLGEKPDWVKNMGDAFLAQPDDVMNAVQRLRQKAQQAGNLKTNEQIKVSTEAPEAAPASTTVVVKQSTPPPQVIVIEPAQPSVVYVPAYNPTVVYGAWPYPAYPPYYYPPPPGYWFSRTIMTGIAWGVGIGVSNALWGGCNWGRGDVEHQRQPLQQHQRQQAPRRQQQPDQLEPQSGAARQYALSRRRRDAQESREQARRRQPRAVPRQGREPRREPRARAAVDAGARRRRRFGLGPRAGAERRPRRGQAEGAGRGSRCGPFEGTEHRSRRGPAARAADLAGQRAQGRGRPTGQAAGRPRRVQPEGRRPLRRWGCRTVARRPAVAPRRPHRPEEVAHGRRRRAAVLGRVVAVAGAVGLARVVAAAVVVVADDKRR